MSDDSAEKETPGAGQILTDLRHALPQLGGLGVVAAMIWAQLSAVEAKLDLVDAQIATVREQIAAAGGDRWTKSEHLEYERAVQRDLQGMHDRVSRIEIIVGER